MLTHKKRRQNSVCKTLNTNISHILISVKTRDGLNRPFFSCRRAGEGDYLPNSATASERETSTSSRVTSASSRVAGM